MSGGAPASSGRGLVLAAFVLLAIVVALLETAYLPSFDDPMEMGYVDFSRHLAKGEGLATSMLALYYAPRIPAPISLWPPLYPAAVAGLSAVGLGVPVAARVVSILAFGLSVALVWVLGSKLFDRTVATMSAALFAVWPAVTRIATSALSESLFVALVLLSVVVSLELVRGQRGPSLWYGTAAGGLAMGAAAFTRYVGLALIAISAAALVVNLRGRSIGERLTIAAVWSGAAAILPGLFLVRNLLVTGTLIGAGRFPERKGLVYHTIFSFKAVAADALKLLWRITIVPEVLGLDSRVMVFAVVGVAGLLALWFVRSSRGRSGLVRALGIPVASPGRRFVMSIIVGYWAAMLAAHSVWGFTALSTRMMMPAYPLLLVFAVAIVGALADGIHPSARKVLAWVVVLLCVGGVVGVIGPRSIAAGGPRLRPGPPPPWVDWVAANTPPNAPIVGNRGFDYNFYLERPVLSFAGYLDYRSGDRFDRDCRAMVQYLKTLGWNHAYLVLHAEDEGGIDIDMMGRRYGKMIDRLLRGEPVLPVRLIVRRPEFAAYEILDLSWNCNRE